MTEFVMNELVSNMNRIKAELDDARADLRAIERMRKEDTIYKMGVVCEVPLYGYYNDEHCEYGVHIRKKEDFLLVLEALEHCSLDRIEDLHDELDDLELRYGLRKCDE